MAASRSAISTSRSCSARNRLTSRGVPSRSTASSWASCRRPSASRSTRQPGTLARGGADADHGHVPARGSHSGAPYVRRGQGREGRPEVPPPPRGRPRHPRRLQGAARRRDHAPGTARVDVREGDDARSLLGDRPGGGEAGASGAEAEGTAERPQGRRHAARRQRGVRWRRACRGAAPGGRDPAGAGDVGRRCDRAARALRRGVLPVHQRSRSATRGAVSSPRRALRPHPGRGAAGTRPMKIEDILTEDLVIPALGARSKTDALVELATAVARRHPELERERLVQALEDRERLNSTALGDGVAIPHGKLPGIKRVFAAFARSPQGVDFQSLDGRPTHLFFLLVAPEDSAGAHLKALARISRLLKNEEFRARLMQATDARALWETIREEDARY